MPPGERPFGLEGNKLLAMVGLAARRIGTVGRQRVLVVLALSALVCLAGCRVPSPPSWQVVRVDDGDTVVLRNGEGETRFRLAGIDAPEQDQPFGPEARRMLAELLESGPIAVDARGEDRYGRTVAVLYVGYTNVNETMVSRGGAWWFEPYARGNVALERLQAGARSRRLGLWGAGEPPVPPWEWRSAKHERDAGQSR